MTPSIRTLAVLRFAQDIDSAGIASGVNAPVITATVSLILIFFGFNTATRLPRRAGHDAGRV